MVMGEDSSPELSGVESQHSILDGHFFTYICYKNCNVCLKRQKQTKKRPGVANFQNSLPRR